MTKPMKPTVGENVFIDPTAYVAGDVTIGDGCSILPQVSIRGDVAPIRIGKRCNVQDGSVLHCKGNVPLEIADDVGIGHRAVVHCKSIGSHTLIGTGSILLDDVEVGEGCIIAAGAVIPPGKKIPDGKLVVGMPGRVLRDVTEEDRKYIDLVVNVYQDLGARHAAGEFVSWE